MSRTPCMSGAGWAGVILYAVISSGSISAQSQTLVLEDFRAKEEDGFPSKWGHEELRSEAKGRSAYKVVTENGGNYLAVKDAGQRIKNKKIDWDPKAYPILTWRWRINKVPEGTDQIGAIFVTLDTDFMLIPVWTKYLWSATKPEGTLSEGGMFSGAEIIVQSGTREIGKWIEERVNVYEDFKRIHQHEPAPKAWGISISASPGVEIDFGPLVAVTGK